MRPIAPAAPRPDSGGASRAGSSSRLPESLRPHATLIAHLVLWIGLAAIARLLGGESDHVGSRPFGYFWRDEASLRSLAPVAAAIVLFAVVTLILPVAQTRRVRAAALVALAGVEWWVPVVGEVIQVPLAVALLLAAWLTLRSASPRAFAVLLPAAAVLGFGALFVQSGGSPVLALVVKLLPALIAAALAPISSRLMSRTSAPIHGGVGRPHPGGYPAAYPPGFVAPQNTLAIVAFVLSFFVSVPGIVCGHVALVQIKRTGERGRGLAIAALVIGYVGLALLVVYLVAIAALLHSA